MVCDGLKRLPNSIRQVLPETTVQTRLTHLLRNQGVGKVGG